MEIPDLENDGCPYRSACVELRIELTEACINPKYKKCLKYQEYEGQKAEYVFDSLVGSK